MSGHQEWCHGDLEDCHQCFVLIIYWRETLEIWGSTNTKWNIRKEFEGSNWETHSDKLLGERLSLCSLLWSPATRQKPLFDWSFLILRSPKATECKRTAVVDYQQSVIVDMLGRFTVTHGNEMSSMCLCVKSPGSCPSLSKGKESQSAANKSIISCRESSPNEF